MKFSKKICVAFFSAAFLSLFSCKNNDDESLFSGKYSLTKYVFEKTGTNSDNNRFTRTETITKDEIEIKYVVNTGENIAKYINPTMNSDGKRIFTLSSLTLNNTDYTSNAAEYDYSDKRNDGGKLSDSITFTSSDSASFAMYLEKFLRSEVYSCTYTVNEANKTITLKNPAFSDYTISYSDDKKTLTINTTDTDTGESHYSTYTKQ